MADQKFKSKVRLQGGAALPAETASRVLTTDSSGDVKSSTVTTTELGYVSGVTSPIQSQITAAQGDATQALADAAAAQADIDNHISDVSDAHDASAISNVPSGNLAATDVQAALNELQGDIDSGASALTAHINDTSDAHDASAISSVPSGNLAATDVQAALNELQSDIDTRIASSQKGAANGVAELDAGGKVPASQLPNSIMDYRGTWNASTNSPTLADGVGSAGDVYIVSVAGSQDLGSGSISFAQGDWVVYNGATWEKSVNSNAVASVFSRTGAVTAQSGDYTASQVTNTPAGSIAATTVQAAINELDGDVQAAQADATQALSDAAAAQSDIDNHLSDTSDAHDASAISVVPTGNLTSTDVQAALVEIQTELDNFNPGSVGDIQETSFSISNNQTSAANVTGFAFAVGVVRGFSALATVQVDATADLFETFELVGINKGGSFEMSVSAVGDESGVTLSITSGGQVQYTSANYSGFVSGAIKFRAITTTV